MATTLFSSWTTARPQTSGWSTSEFLIRALLAAFAVILCYQFRWDWLRSFTADLNLRADALVGIHWQRLSFDTVMWQGQVFTYVVACTFADVWCGAIAFLWLVRRSIAENLRTLAAFTVGLFALNIARLTLSDFLCAHGASWNVGHNVVGGISYFLVWTWLQRHRRKADVPRDAREMVAAGEPR